MKIIFIFACSGMFRNVPACSGMFHVPDFIDGPRKYRHSQLSRVFLTPLCLYITILLPSDNSVLLNNVQSLLTSKHDKKEVKILKYKVKQ